MRFESWPKKMKEELGNSRLDYICQGQQESETDSLRMAVRERCKDADRQNQFTELYKKTSLASYQEMNHKWYREGYTEYCTRNERNGRAWVKVEVWELR
jgi:hypothetical protein